MVRALRQPGRKFACCKASGCGRWLLRGSEVLTARFRGSGLLGRQVGSEAVRSSCVAPSLPRPLILECPASLSYAQVLFAIFLCDKRRGLQRFPGCL